LRGSLAGRGGHWPHRIVESRDGHATVRVMESRQNLAENLKRIMDGAPERPGMQVMGRSGDFHLQAQTATQAKDEGRSVLSGHRRIGVHCGVAGEEVLVSFDES